MGIQPVQGTVRLAKARPLNQSSVIWTWPRIDLEYLPADQHVNFSLLIQLHQLYIPVVNAARWVRKFLGLAAGRDARRTADMARMSGEVSVPMKRTKISMDSWQVMISLNACN